MQVIFKGAPQLMQKRRFEMGGDTVAFSEVKAGNAPVCISGDYDEAILKKMVRRNPDKYAFFKDGELFDINLIKVGKADVLAQAWQKEYQAGQETLKALQLGDASEIVALAHAEAGEIKRQALAEGDEIVRTYTEKASEQAEEIIAKAKREAAQILKTAQDDVAELAEAGRKKVSRSK